MITDLVRKEPYLGLAGASVSKRPATSEFDALRSERLKPVSGACTSTSPDPSELTLSRNCFSALSLGSP
jgi:hypothetical protein